MAPMTQNLSQAQLEQMVQNKQRADALLRRILDSQVVYSRSVKTIEVG